MAAITGIILVGNSHPYGGGSRHFAEIALSENSRPNFSLSWKTRPRDNPFFRRFLIIPTVENMVDDAMMMVSASICRHVETLEYMRSVGIDIDKETVRIELYDDFSEEQRLTLYSIVKSIKNFPKLTFCLFDECHLLTQLDKFKEYNFEYEVLRTVQSKKLHPFSNPSNQLTYEEYSISKIKTIQEISSHEYFLKINEPLPLWLKNYVSNSGFPRNDFFNSRIIYYPGSGFDGQPVEFFSKTHSAHCFLYVDYGIDQKKIEEELVHPNHGFKGYDVLFKLILKESDLVPEGWSQHVNMNDYKNSINNIKWSKGFIDPYGLFVVLSRQQNFDSTHGPERLAIIFLGADGIATYDALFCQNKFQPPFVIVVQDHSVGGNYDKFDRGGIMENLVIQTNSYPKYLLVAENSKVYNQYKDMGLEPVYGGEHRHLRKFYKLNEDVKHNDLNDDMINFQNRWKDNIINYFIANEITYINDIIKELNKDIPDEKKIRDKIRGIHDKLGYRASNDVNCVGSLYRSDIFQNIPFINRMGSRPSRESINNGNVQNFVHIEHTVPVNILAKILIKKRDCIFKNCVIVDEKYDRALAFILKYSITTAMAFSEKKFINYPDKLDPKNIKSPFMRYCDCIKIRNINENNYYIDRQNFSIYNHSNNIVGLLKKLKNSNDYVNIIIRNIEELSNNLLDNF